MLIMIVITCLVFLLLLEIEFLVIAFKESIFWGILCLLFFPLNLLFLLLHWHKAKHNFYKVLIISVVLICTESYMITGNAIPRLHNFTFGLINIQQIVSQAEFFDQAHITLTGKISNFSRKTSTKGDKYTVFRLNDSTGALIVYYRGHASSTNGQYVRVKGIFDRVKRVGNRKVYNQLKAKRISKISKKKSGEGILDFFKNLFNAPLSGEGYFAPPKDKLVNIGKKDKKNDNSLLLAVHKNKLKGIQVSGFGMVYKILTDDLKGDKHQRFILQITPDLTVLVAHNIDLSHRVSPLKVGDLIHFYGQYEWNAEGGVVHWTHHDPNGKHKNGWLERDYKKFH